jgi:hypothetical protein
MNHPVHLVCTVQGCGRKHQAKGLCKAHYNRMLRYGHPGVALIAVKHPAKRKAAKKRDTALFDPPVGGTITLEEWKRRNAAPPVGGVHFVQRHGSTGGDAA